MTNLFDYLNWRGDLDFKASPFNPVDNIILSQLTYLTLDDIVPGPEEKEGITIELAIRIYREKLNSPEGVKQTSFFKDDPKLIETLAASRRFGKCHLFGYVNHVDINREIQFSALGINTTDKMSFIAYRGTDVSIVGWKENFNMSFKEVIPSQIEAAKYLKKMASRIKGRFRVGGHSKGGNLAIYAAANCGKNIQRRITNIYSNDAPGFNEKFLSSAGFISIKNKIISYVPQESIIGMIFKHKYNNIIIKSSQTGILQHDLYSWEVTHNDLVHAGNLTVSSRFVNNTLHSWIDNLDNARREKFIETIYRVFSSAEIKSIHEIETSWFTSVGKILKSLNDVDAPTKKIIRQIIEELLRSAGQNIDMFFKNEEIEDAVGK